MKNKECPLEAVEQRNFVQWLRINKYMFTAIPNSTYTTSWHQKIKNKQQGLNSGLPDLVIIVKNHLVFIEMKRQIGGIVSENQIKWIKAINNCEEVEAHVCKGCQNAIDTILDIENKIISPRND